MYVSSCSHLISLSSTLLLPFFFSPDPLFSSFLTLLSFVPFPSPGSCGCREDQRGSAPRGAKDVAFPSEHLQPPGVHPGCSPFPVEHQTLYHMSGNLQRHCIKRQIGYESADLQYTVFAANNKYLLIIITVVFPHCSCQVSLINHSMRSAVTCLCLFFMFKSMIL